MCLPWINCVLADGSRLVSAGGSTDHNPGGQVRLWDAATGRLLRTFEGHQPFAVVDRVALSPDGSRVLSSGSDKAVKLWDTASGRLLHSFLSSRLPPSSRSHLRRMGSEL